MRYHLSEEDEAKDRSGDGAMSKEGLGQESTGGSPTHFLRREGPNLVLTFPAVCTKREI